MINVVFSFLYIFFFVWYGVAIFCLNFYYGGWWFHNKTFKSILWNLYLRLVIIVLVLIFFFLYYFCMCICFFMYFLVLFINRHKIFKIIFKTKKSGDFFMFSTHTPFKLYKISRTSSHSSLFLLLNIFSLQIFSI